MGCWAICISFRVFFTGSHLLQIVFPHMAARSRQEFPPKAGSRTELSCQCFPAPAWVWVGLRAVCLCSESPYHFICPSPCLSRMVCLLAVASGHPWLGRCQQGLVTAQHLVELAQLLESWDLHFHERKSLDLQRKRMVKEAGLVLDRCFLKWKLCRGGKWDRTEGCWQCFQKNNE